MTRALALLSTLGSVLLIGCGDKTGGDDTGSADDVDDTAADDTDTPVDADGDGHTAATDCDDADPLVFPGAEEVCDGVDNDCDGQVDVDATDGATFYGDADGDGYGAPDATATLCAAETGWVDDATDCDDADAGVNPGATEVCDDADVDEDCDGLSDDADDSVDPAGLVDWHTDADADGYGDPDLPTAACDGASGTVADGTDCDDGDADIHPAAQEICDDADVDEDCDGLSDDADASVDVAGFGTFYADADADGYGDAASSAAACDAPSGAVADATDCDDTDAAVNPGATEVCDDADVDEDCDGLADDADSSVDPATRTSFYRDGDADGYGDAAAATAACDPPSGAVTDATDCDDGDAAINPGAQEVCDVTDTDEDCDGLADDADGSVDTSTYTTWYADADLDGYGDASVFSEACEQPSGTVSDRSDCDDTDPDVNPAASEECDGVDNDCDGSLGATEVDSDGDDCYVCEGDPDDGDSSLGCETTVEVSGTTSSWTTSSYFRANVYQASDDLTLESYAVNLGLASSCVLDYYVHEASSTSGPWTLLWRDQVSASAGSGWQDAGDVDVDLTAGLYYSLGVAWNCSATYLGAYTGPETVTDFGTASGTRWDNAYPGYSASYDPPNLGSGSTLYNQTVTFR